MFFTFFYQPIINLLVFLAEILPGNDLGLAIIGVTLIVKGILFPLTFKTMKAQREMKALQPKVNEIKEKYKDDKEKMSQELMAVYKDNKVNPLGSCLPLLVQIPVFLGIFRVLQSDLSIIPEGTLYSFVNAPENLNTLFLGAIDLSQVFIPFAILAAAMQYWQVKSGLPPKPANEVAKKAPGALDEDMAANMQRMMLYFIPGITLLVGSTTLPAGIMMYWMTTTLMTVVLNKIFLPKDEKEEKEA